MSFQKRLITEKYDEGYRITEDGCLLNPKGEVLSYYVNKRDKWSYKSTSLKLKGDRVNRPLFHHKFQAYTKYGEKIFQKGIVVRHLNGDKTDNSWKNISIGTQSQNMLDRSEEDRLCHAIKASGEKRKFTDNEILKIKQFYNKVKSYKITMKEFGITSKGSLHYILNNVYVTTK